MPDTLLPYLSLLLIALGPTGVIVWLKYFRGRPGPKDQEYYETLIARAWSASDRIQTDLDREIGRRQAIETELEKERQRAGVLVARLQRDLDESKKRCDRLEIDLDHKLSEVRSLRAALAKWRAEGGESIA